MLDRISAGLTENPGTNRLYKPQLLCQRDELTWHDNPPCRVVPAQQRLEFAEAIALQIKERLIGYFELFPLERNTKIRLVREACMQPNLHVGLKDAVASPSSRLRLIECHIGVPEERIAVHVGVGCDGNTDADTDVDRALT